MDLKPSASRSWRAFVADCVPAQGPSWTQRNAEVAAKSDVATFQIDASKRGGGNKYASCGRTRREWFLASERRSTAPTGPQPSTSEDARKRHLLHRRARNFGSHPRPIPAN